MGYILIVTYDSTYNKTVNPSYFEDESRAKMEFNEFINDYIICSDDEELKKYVDQIINDDDHNLVTTDGERLCEMVYDQIDELTDRVVTGETSCSDTAIIEQALHVTYDDGGYADCVLYKI